MRSRSDDEPSALVDDLLTETCAWGRGTIGPDACQKAFEYGEVEVLILADELDDERKCRLVQLAEQAGARVVTVDQCEKLIELGGAGCLLRYREADPQFRNLAAV